MVDYCSPADLYSFGLPRGSLPNAGRLAGGVNTTTNAVELDAHGFSAGDPVTFRAESGGTLASPLQASVTYYAQPLTDSAFCVSITATGAAIDLTTAGSGLIVIAPLPIASAIAWASRILEDLIPAHLVPLDVVPDIVRMTVAELAIGKLAGITGGTSKSLTDMVDSARNRLARWAKGVPLRGDANARPAAASCAQTAIAPFNDARGWHRYGGIG
jgi:hypothetical protein